MNTSNISYCNMFIFALTHRHGTVTVLLNFINDLFPWYSGHGTYKLSIDDLCIFPFSTTQQHFYVFFFLLRRTAIWPFCMQSVFELKLQKFSIRFYRFENVRLQPWTQKVKTQNDIFHFSVHKNVILNNHKKIIPVKYSTHQNRRSFKEPSSVDAHKTESSSTMYAVNKAVYFEFIEN